MVMESVEMYIETWKTEPEFSKNILLTQSTVFRRVVKDLSIAITIAFSNSALKVSKFGIFLVLIFSHSDWIQKNIDQKPPNTVTFSRSESLSEG